MVEYWVNWTDKYKFYHEDGLHEEDWESWGDLTSEIGSSVQFAGDDLFVNNVNLWKEVENNVANSIW